MQALELDPGDVRNVNCTENCINDSLQVSCANCPVCNTTECGICSIDRTLSWNETYNNSEGPCDLNIKCEPMNLTMMGRINFPSRIKVKKDSGNFILSIDVYDQNGMILESWNKQISQEDVVEYSFEYNYTCPADLTTDVNMETCSPFLANVFNTTNPMVFQMVTGQTLCMQKLVDCQGERNQESDTANQWQQEYNRILNQYNDMEDLYNNCYLELDYDNPKSTVNKITSTVRAEKAGWVPGEYALGFWILLFLVFAVIGAVLYREFVF